MSSSYERQIRSLGFDSHLSRCIANRKSKLLTALHGREVLLRCVDTQKKRVRRDKGLNALVTVRPTEENDPEHGSGSLTGILDGLSLLFSAGECPLKDGTSQNRAKHENYSKTSSKTSDQLSALQFQLQQQNSSQRVPKRELVIYQVNNLDHDYLELQEVQ